MPGTTESVKETITVAGVVKFVPATNESKARFYTIVDGGKDEDVVFDSHEAMLNPLASESIENHDLFADANFPNGLYWESTVDQTTQG